MDKAWFGSYPPGMPTEIDADAFASINHLMEDAFARHGRREFARCMGRTMRYDELDDLSRAFAGWLQRRGVLPGARVAIMLPNILQFPVAAVGALRAGCTIVTVNPLYTPRELEHQLSDSGAEAIVVLENFASTLEQVVARTAIRHVAVASLGDLLGFPKGPIVNHVVRRVRKLVPAYRLSDAVPFRRALADGRKQGWTPVARSAEDLAFLQYTGGTTGISKGAMLTHRNVVAAVMQANAAIDAGLAWRKASVPQLHVITALPLYHIYALAACLLVGMTRGHLLTLVPNPRDIPELVKTLGERPVPHVPGAQHAVHRADERREVPRARPVVAAVHAGRRDGDDAVGRRALAGDDRLRDRRRLGHVRDDGDRHQHAGQRDRAHRQHRRAAAVDRPGRARRRQPRRAGRRTGRAVHQGPNVTPGYYNRPDETARALTPDGYFRTGDIGTMDERGFFRIVDRKKDMILVSGFNVFPTEIEAVVSGHPKVLECAAVGIPDEHSGEAVRLFVVPREAGLDERELRDWCRERMTGYKLPKSIVFRKELPKTPVGKVLRRALREDAPAPS